MSIFFPNGLKLYEKFSMLIGHYEAYEIIKSELINTNGLLNELKSQLVKMEKTLADTAAAKYNLEHTVSGIEIFKENFGQDNAMSKFKESYLKAKRAFESIDGDKKINKKKMELETATAEYSQAKEKLQSMEVRLIALRDGMDKDTSRKREIIKEIKKLEKDIAKNRKIQENKAAKINAIEKEIAGFEEIKHTFEILTTFKNFLISNLFKQKKKMEEITEEDFIEVTDKIRASITTLAKQEMNMLEYKNKLIRKIDEYRSKQNELEILLRSNVVLKHLKMCKERTKHILEQTKKRYLEGFDSLKLAEAALQYLETNKYMVLDVAQKTISRNMGIIVSAYNTKLKRFEELIIKMDIINGFAQNHIAAKVAETIDFKLLHEDVSTEQALDPMIYGNIIITSDRIVSDSFENLGDFISNPRNRKLFISDETLITSMLDILTGAIAINCKDLRGCDIAIDMSDPQNLMAHVTDIQSKEYWLPAIEEGCFEYDLDKISRNVYLTAKANIFGKISFFKKSSLIKTISELFFEGQIPGAYNAMLGTTAFNISIDNYAPLFDAFQLIAMRPDADKKLIESFEKTATSLIQKLEDRSLNAIAKEKIENALTRLQKLNDIVRNNCGKEILSRKTLSTIEFKKRFNGRLM